MYKRILLAYDGSQAGQKALLDCREAAQMQGSELFLIAVMPQDPVFTGGEGAFYDPRLAEMDKKKYEGILAEGLSRLSDPGREVQGHIVVGHPVVAGLREDREQPPHRRPQGAPGQPAVGVLDLQVR